MSKLIVEVSPEIHKALKQKALDSHRTLRAIVSELLEGSLNVATGSGPPETGLCGAWEDDRTPQGIVRDLKAHRTGWVRSRG